MLKKLLLATVMVLSLTSTVKANTNDIFGVLDSHKFVFTFEEEFRLKDTSSDSPVFYEHSDIQAKYLINKYVDVFTDYRLVFQNKGKGWNDQSMFLEGFNLKLPESTNWGRVNLRTRLEIGLNSSPTPTTYTLNVFPKYNSPWRWTKFQINPFVADELFFDCERSLEFNKNRGYVGVDWKINNRIKASTYYYHENSYVGGKPADVAVQQIKFEF